MSNQLVKVDLSAIESLTGALESVDAASVGKLAMSVVNSAVDAAYDTARQRMTRAINLTDSYVQERMVVKHAKSANDVTASIVASGASTAMTILARYQARQIVKPVKNPARSKGDQLFARNIAPTYKSAGISVEVTRGSRKTIANAFYMPLRNAEKVGVFMRTGKGRDDYKHLYGPSVYQLFKHCSTDLAVELTDELEEKLTVEINNMVEKALK